jgi:drug/metabolite transporter (DMT)-like permease
MAFPVFLAVVLAAFLHASWNLLVKINLDRFLAVFLIHTLMGLVGAGLLVYAGMPASACWPYAFASGVLHTGYNLLLARSYRTGDMSVVYPVARGAAPTISLVLSVVFAGDHISSGELAGLCILIGGLWLVAFGKAARLATDTRTLGFAFATALFIGLYTVVDGLGARAAHDAIAYSGLIYFLDGLFLLIIGLVMRGPAIFAQVIPFFWRGLAGSLMSSLAYGIVIWAMTVEKIGPVAALRETSILFVLVMSRFVLKEQLTPLRIAGGGLIVAGAAVLRFA